MKLITNINEVLQHVPVSLTNDIETLRPYLSSAESSWVARTIGTAQLNALSEIYTAAGNADAIDDDQIRQAVLLSQKITSNLAFYNALPVLSVSISQNGIQVSSTENVKQAFQWQVEEVKESLFNIGLNSIDDLLEVIENSPDIFTEYFDSEEYRRNEALLITNSREFSSYFNIRDSRFVFQSVQYIMKRVEDRIVSPLITKTLLSAIKVEHSGVKQALAECIKPAIALHTIARALKERVIDIEQGTAKINLKGSYANTKDNRVPEMNRIQEMYDQLVADADAYLAEALEMISISPESFPEYLSPKRRQSFTIKNDKRKGIYGI